MPQLQVRAIRTEDLPPRLESSLRLLMSEAYGPDYQDVHWQMALGGAHFVVEEDGEPLSHASVIERILETPDLTLRTGYVEAVATKPSFERRGLATMVMKEAGGYIRATYDMGGLSTGENSFYERLGWETWRGPLFVRVEDGWSRIPSEDGNVMILRTPATPALDMDAPLSCSWRPLEPW